MSRQEAAEAAIRPPGGGGVRIGVWVIHMALPVLALWLLLARPDLDGRWQHRPSHFWLVLAVAAVNLVLALRMQGAARDHQDPRLLLVAYAFTTSAGFLFLHALATPGVLVGGPNGGFEVATPVGLALASVFFALSAFDPGARTAASIVRSERVIRLVLVGSMAGWAVLSLSRLPPLDQPLAERAEGPMRWVAVVAIGLYLLAALRYFSVHRRRPAVMLVAIITAATLLAEAMAAVVLARAWHASWWEWHLLMTAAFGFVAYSAYVQYRREGSAVGLFNTIATEATVRQVRRAYGDALDSLTSVLERSATGAVGEADVELISAGLRAKFDLTEGQTEVLGRAARALADERSQTRRLSALARFGTGARIGSDEEQLLAEAVDLVGDAFTGDVMRIGLARHDGLAYPDRLTTAPWPANGDRRSFPIDIRGHSAGTIEFSRPDGSFDMSDEAVMGTLAAEVAIALENLRLYRQLDGLFRSYMSPDVADALIADPSQAALGGQVLEITALFADLRGFTSFSERSSPAAIVEMLNHHFGLAVPVVLANGGTVVQFQGDALLAIFNAPARQEDHALRAARTGLKIQEAIDAAGAETGWPRFRIGINTGEALVGNIGSDELRSFNVMGDAINVAARLEALAEPGTVVIGPRTHAALAHRAVARPLGSLELKGREHMVEAYVLDRLDVS